MKSGLILIWIFSLMVITVASSYSFKGQYDIQIFAEEEERSGGNNLSEEQKIKAISNLYIYSAQGGSQIKTGNDHANGLGCNPLYEYLISKINEIPPEVIV